MNELQTYSETTAQGTVSYAFDAAGRRATMTAGTQAQIVYSFDNANRLSQLQQGTSTTGFKNGANTLGNLTYTYDADSRVLQKGGTFARTGLPQPVSSATYDAANQLLRWGDLSLSYDAAGNMLSDGSNAFTWDARGQVSSVNAVSPLYDAFGRRTKNLAGTQMLFDGADSVQEIVGSTVTANRLTGGLDEFFSRADSTGSYYPLSDNLGSTVALTNSTPNVVTAYTYDPYGAISVSGSNSNFFDYTGRENDGNGLYYYRSRYYEPTLGRFVSEDPAGFVGGMNGYAYANDNPINFLNPLGLAGFSIEKYENDLLSANSDGLAEDIAARDEAMSNFDPQNPNAFPPIHGRKLPKFKDSLHCWGEGLWDHKLSITLDLVGLIPGGGLTGEMVRMAADAGGVAASGVGIANGEFGSTATALIGSGAIVLEPTDALLKGGKMIADNSQVIPGIGSAAAGVSLSIDGYNTYQTFKECYNSNFKPQ